MKSATFESDGVTQKIGIIGLGLISGMHFDALYARSDYKIQSLSDTNYPLLVQKGNELGIRALYPNYLQMLQEQDIDVVSVLTPHFIHRDCVMEALVRNVTVICEKPIATTLSDIDAMMDAARKTKHHIYVKQYLRHSLAYIKAQEIISQQIIGKPYFVQCTFTSNSIGDYANPDTWRGNSKEAGGGVFIDVGEHMLDLLQMMFGKPTATYARWKKVLSPLPQKGEDFISAVIEFPQDITVNINCTENDIGYWFRWEVRIYGTNGVMTIIDNGKDEKVLQVFRNNILIDEFIEQDWWIQSNIRAVHDILDRIRDHRPPEVALEHARSVMQTILQTYESAKTGKRIQIP